MFLFFLLVSPIASLPVGLPFVILTARRRPFHRGFFCSDDSIKYPYKEDTISYQLLGGVMIPVTVLTVSATVFFLAPSSALLLTCCLIYQSIIFSFIDELLAIAD